MKRNLLYFCYPLPGIMLNENMKELVSHWPLFTGTKILFFAVDKDTISQTAIVSLLKCHGIFNDENMEFFFVPNDGRIRETAHFIRMMTELFKRMEPGSISFYAHSKGIKSIKDVKYSLLQWMRAMWSLNISKITSIEKALTNGHEFAGVFQYTEPFGDVKVPWHYSGTFFWFSDAIFKKRWNNILQTRHGVESYPATISPIEKSFCIAYQNPNDLYDLKTWQKLKF